MSRNQGIADSYCPSQDWDRYCCDDRYIKPFHSYKLYIEWLTKSIWYGFENIETCFIFWYKTLKGNLKDADDFWYWLNYGSSSYQEWLYD